MIIWSDKRDEYNKIVPWTDPHIQAILKATKSFIADHPKDIQVETFAKKPFPPTAETQTQVFVYFRP
ncbi:hypothetical protein MCC93_16950 [Morococcus cerebrosus]|uniref:Uncharacterized protein n=1 Tax=Morococcus cerebrosus TaxID=1056807 RepID=A0A0C1E4J2_9NEIS|nr:hypothetical protein MCC93_16950 [Morococcus cerebrosus]